MSIFYLGVSVEFYYFEVFDCWGGRCFGCGRVDFEAEECAFCLPALFAGGSGVDVEEVEGVVVDDFEDMGVSADEEVDFVVFEEGFHSGSIFSGVAADVGNQHAKSFELKYEEFGVFASDFSMIDVAADGSEGGDVFEFVAQVDVADVAGVPYFIALGKVFFVS